MYIYVTFAQRSVYIAYYTDIHLPQKETSMILIQTALTSTELECSQSNSRNLQKVTN